MDGAAEASYFFKGSKVGWLRPILVEPLILVREYEFQWIRPEIDLAELAKLRFVEKWPIQRLAGHFRVGTTRIYQCLSRIKQEAIWVASKN